MINLPVLSDSLWPHGLQHARPPCSSSSPGVCPNSCPLHQRCHPSISFSDTLFSFCPQSFPASGTFTINWLFASGDQNTRASVSALVLPMRIQRWFPLRLTGLHIYIYIFFRFFSIIGYYKISNIVSCAILRILVVQSLYSWLLLFSASTHTFQDMRKGYILRKPRRGEGSSGGSGDRIK